MRPAVTARTERTYGRLPEAYRDADEALDWPLLRYLSLLLDQLDPLDALVERIDYDAEEGGTSDLVDGATANVSWFRWLAQVLGVNLEGLTLAEQRLALSSPLWDHGTPPRIAAAAARGLTGTRAVTVTPHYAGAPFVIGIGTRDSETGTVNTWAKLKAAAPTWAALESLESFVAGAAELATAEVERPAGFRFVRYSTGA